MWRLLQWSYVWIGVDMCSKSFHLSNSFFEDLRVKLFVFILIVVDTARCDLVDVFV